MVLLNFLRALADLGFYYSLAGMLSAAAGGRLALAVFLLQGVCFALSFALRRDRIVRLAALLPTLLPALLALYLPVALADVLVSLPPVIYLAYLAWTDGYHLSWYRQADQFNVFWRVFLPTACIVSLMGSWMAVLAAGIPVALVTAVASILLMRSLRHEPSVYLQPGYQLINLAGIVLVVLMALVVGSEWVLWAAALILGTFYEHVIVPLVLGLGILIGSAALLVWPLLELLAAAIYGIFERKLQVQTNIIDQMDKLRDSIPQGRGDGTLAVQIVIALLILFAIAVLALVFYWMIQQHRNLHGASVPTRRDLSAQRTAQDESVYARRIRRQYQAFLRLCLKEGLQFSTSDTSTDIGGKALPEFPDKPSLSALRDIYQRARYNGKASKADYLEFNQLLKKLREL